MVWDKTQKKVEENEECFVLHLDMLFAFQSFISASDIKKTIAWINFVLFTVFFTSQDFDVEDLKAFKESILSACDYDKDGKVNKKELTTILLALSKHSQEPWKGSFLNWCPVMITWKKHSLIIPFTGHLISMIAVSLARILSMIRFHYHHFNIHTHTHTFYSTIFIPLSIWSLLL